MQSLFQSVVLRFHVLPVQSSSSKRRVSTLWYFASRQETLVASRQETDKAHPL